MKVLKVIARLMADLFTPGLDEREMDDCKSRFPRLLAQYKRGCWSWGETCRLYRRFTLA
jgi:hypothetical protein